VLATLAPLIAVRGNNDVESWAKDLPDTEMIRVGGVFVYVIHDLSRLDIEPRAAGVQVIVSGHSHRPGAEEREGILYINPGSCGPKRFKLPISVGELWVRGSHVRGNTVELSVAR